MTSAAPAIQLPGTTPAARGGRPARVAVGLSGGVDSTIAALLLKRQGYEVIGLTMRIYGGQLGAAGTGKAAAREGKPAERPASKATGAQPAAGTAPAGAGQRPAAPARPAAHACFGPDEEEEIARAASVARRLGIPHHVVDLRKEYDETVLSYFSAEYAAGRTPNPCVFCNCTMKFGLLVDRAFESGIEFDAFATGHYVRSRQDPATGLFELLRAVDGTKDQSYFLYRLTQRELARVVFPLGELCKTAVKELAREAGFTAEADQRESQNFTCGDYGDLIRSPVRPGNFVDRNGSVLGRHRGIPYYTIGQRRGLGIAVSGEPLYVVRIDAKRNEIVLGSEREIYGTTLTARDMQWTAGKAYRAPAGAASGRLAAKIRSQSALAAATVEPLEDGRVRVTFEQPQLAITPGQSVVLYADDTVVGGGIIEGE